MWMVKYCVMVLRWGGDGRVFWACTEWGRCKGGKYQSSWQLTDAGVGRFEWMRISFVEVREAVNEIKSSKAPGRDEFPVECLKKGGTAI